MVCCVACGIQDGADESSLGLLSRCLAGEVFVVPAFEKRLPEQQQEAVLTPPVSLEELSAGFQAGSVTPFHVSHFPAGHNPTDYQRFVCSAPSNSEPCRSFMIEYNCSNCWCVCRRWFEVSVGHRQDDADGMGTYQVRYSEYYEPYVIMAEVRSFIEIVCMDGNPFIVYVCMFVYAGPLSAV